MLLVTFHGDPADDRQAGGAGSGNLVSAYSDEGALLAEQIIEDPPAVLAQPRCIALLPNGLLWVVSGSARESNILSFTGSGTQYSYTGQPVAQYPAVDSLWHPFDLTFASDADGTALCYVSNQDTNTVARLAISADFARASPMPISSALPSDGYFLSGTFVASARGDLPGLEKPTTPVPPPPGLEVDTKGGKVQHSVRGVLWHDDALYVADEVAGTVKVYDASGTYRGQSNALGSPDHLVAQGGVLYVGSGSQVYQGGAVSAIVPAVLDFTAIAGIELSSVAGMAFGPTGDLYVADRTGRQLWRYAAPDFSGGTAIGSQLPDNPEFLIHVPDPA
jgi:hypothetical protein